MSDAHPAARVYAGEGPADLIVDIGGTKVLVFPSELRWARTVSRRAGPARLRVPGAGLETATGQVIQETGRRPRGIEFVMFCQPVIGNADYPQDRCADKTAFQPRPLDRCVGAI